MNRKDLDDSEAVMTLFWPAGQGPPHEPDGQILMERDMVCPITQYPDKIEIRCGKEQNVAVYRLVALTALRDEAPAEPQKAKPVAEETR